MGSAECFSLLFELFFYAAFYSPFKKTSRVAIPSQRMHREVTSAQPPPLQHLLSHLDPKLASG